MHTHVSTIFQNSGKRRGTGNHVDSSLLGLMGNVLKSVFKGILAGFGYFMGTFNLFRTRVRVFVRDDEQK